LCDRHQPLVRETNERRKGCIRRAAVGFVLAATMLCLVVIQNVIVLVNVLFCAACLVLLFFEAAFGICIGCKVCILFNRQPSRPVAAGRGGVNIHARPAAGSQRSWAGRCRLCGVGTNIVRRPVPVSQLRKSTSRMLLLRCVE
jgi:hypothetical protein